MKFPRFEFHISAGVTEFTSFAIVNASCNGIAHPQRPSRNILERHTDSSLRLDLGKIHRSVFFRGTGSQKHFSSNSYSQTHVISYMTGRCGRVGLNGVRIKLYCTILNAKKQNSLESRSVAEGSLR